MNFKFIHKKNARRTFIVLPGVMSDEVSIDFLVPALRRHGHVLWVNYPNRRATTETLIKKVLEEIEKRDLKKIIIVGYSYGGSLGRKLIDKIRDHRRPIKVEKFIAINAALDTTDLTALGRVATKISSRLGHTERSRILLGHLLKFFWDTSLDPAL